MRPADASVEGVLQRPLSTCASLLQGAWAAPLHPAQGTGLLRLQVPPVSYRLSQGLARAAPCGRAHGSTVSACGLFFAAVEAAATALRSDAQSGQPDQARHEGVGRPGLTPARAPSSCVCAPAWPSNPSQTPGQPNIFFFDFIGINYAV